MEKRADVVAIISETNTKTCDNTQDYDEIPIEIKRLQQQKWLFFGHCATVGIVHSRRSEHHMVCAATPFISIAVERQGHCNRNHHAAHQTCAC
jgi:hypothetical protein